MEYHVVAGDTRVMQTAPTLRIARPTDRIAEVVAFYEDALGLVRLGSFEDHDGFDGVMVGIPGASYHLEFTRNRRHASTSVPTPDHLLVVYLPDRQRWTEAVQRMKSAGHLPVHSLNPYWDKHGLTFEDPDGYRVVLQNASWPEETDDRGGIEHLEQVPPGEAREAFVSLLRLADDSEAQIRSYYQRGELFALRAADNAVRGVVLAVPFAEDAVELKAVAVAPSWQGRGVGKRLLACVLSRLKAAGATHVVVGTATSSVGAIAFYQKAGFRAWKVERDFFSSERGYAEGIEENGIVLRDILWLDQQL
jgi:ribosomal protein S18 acetylase RimI-like enzyme